MQYISPFSFFPNSISSSFTRKDFVLAKRKLMAEFELQGTATIIHNGKEISRNDVITFFDTLEKSDDLDFHALVASSPELLYFLENAKIEHHSKFSLPADKITPEFIEWISPYYSNAFKKCSYNNFKNVEMQQLNALLKNAEWMTSADRYKAWQGVENYFAALTQQFEQVNESNERVTEQTISTFTRFELIDMIAILPIDIFQQLINQYAFEMMRSSIIVFNKIKNREWAIVILENAETLPVDETTMHLLTDKEDEMRRIMHAENSHNTKKDSSTWVGLRGVGFLIFVIIKLFATCNRTSSYSNNYEYPKITYTAPTVYEKEIPVELSAEDIAATGNFHFHQDTLLMGFLNSLQPINEIKNSETVKMVTGQDPYKRIWALPMFTKHFKPTLSVIDKLAIEPKLTSSKQAIHFVTTQNNSNFNIVVFVCRKDSVYSRFINAHSSFDIALLEGSNKVYIYAGTDFSYNKNFALRADTKNISSINTYASFTENVINNLHLLMHPIYFSCTRTNGKETNAIIKVRNDSEDASIVSIHIKNSANTTHLSRFDAAMNFRYESALNGREGQPNY